MSWSKIERLFLVFSPPPPTHGCFFCVSLLTRRKEDGIKDWVIYNHHRIDGSFLLSCRIDWITTCAVGEWVSSCRSSSSLSAKVALHCRQACGSLWSWWIVVEEDDESDDEVDDEDVLVETGTDVTGWMLFWTPLGTSCCGCCCWRAAMAAEMAAALSWWTFCRCSRKTAGDGKPLLQSQHLAKYSATTSWRPVDGPRQITNKHKSR